MHHNFVANVPISADLVNLARVNPDDLRLKNLADFTWFLFRRFDDGQVINVADKLLKGIVDIPGAPSKRINLPFDKNDIDRGERQWQLFQARLGMPQILLKAYDATKRDAFLALARDIILGWARFERKAWRTRGLLWNDHATAVRIQVLAEFWRHYRQHTMFDLQTARDVLLFVARAGRFLAKPSFYTFASNHGMIQNLGLMHLCLAFPDMPDTQKLRQLATDRTLELIDVYLNEEGVFLEHSSLYQKFNIELLHRALGYLKLLDVPVPGAIEGRYRKAKVFYALLRRPDGTLPVYGDSWGQSASPNPWLTAVDEDNHSLALADGSSLKPDCDHSLYPVAGYAVWWNGREHWPDERRLNQLVIGWSYYPGHAHKHADEMSVLLWAGGTNWWSNIGNWPRGLQGRLDALNWNGSNAPHLTGEAYDSERETHLCRFGWDKKLAFIEMQREGPDNYRVRRQIIHHKPDVWMVFDSSIGDEKVSTTTVWNTTEDVAVTEREQAGLYEMDNRSKNSRLLVAMASSTGTRVRHLKGSNDPFAGWETDRFEQKPVSALVVEQPAKNGWCLCVWKLVDNARQSQEQLSLPSVSVNNQGWQIWAPINGSGIKIVLNEDSLCVDYPDGDRCRLALAKGPAVEISMSEIKSNFKNSKNRYPSRRWRALCRRYKVTDALTFLLSMQNRFYNIS